MGRPSWCHDFGLGHAGGQGCAGASGQGHREWVRIYPVSHGYRLYNLSYNETDFEDSFGRLKYDKWSFMRH